MEQTAVSNKFYVYTHSRKDTGEVFYVGKGNLYAKGVKKSPELITLIIQKNTGKKRSDEFCERLRLMNLGKKHSEATKQKIRDSWVIRKANAAKHTII